MYLFEKVQKLRYRFNKNIKTDKKAEIKIINDLNTICKQLSKVLKN
ncbi:MAG: hypothetical protein ACI4OT_00610 [Bacilli bacterium]